MNGEQQATVATDEKSALPNDLKAERESELVNQASRLVDEVTTTAATDASQPPVVSAIELPCCGSGGDAGGDHTAPPKEGEVEVTLSEPGAKLDVTIAQVSFGQPDGEPSTCQPEPTITVVTAENNPEPAAAERNAVEVVISGVPSESAAAASAVNQLESVENTSAPPREQLVPEADKSCEAQNPTAESEVTRDAVGQPAHNDLEAQPERTSETQGMLEEPSATATRPPLPPTAESRQHQDSVSETETLPSGMDELSDKAGAGGGNVLPPDSPRTGKLIMLTPKLSSEGEVEIERTLLDPGIKATGGKDDDESNELPAEAQPDVTKQEAEEQKDPSEEPGTTITTSGVLVNGEEAPSADEKMDVSAAPTTTSLTPEVEIAVLGPLHVEAFMEQKTEVAAPVLPAADVRASAPSPPRPPPPKVTRTQTLPASPSSKNKKSKGLGANMPWQKKRASDDADIRHDAEHQHHHQEHKGGANPFSGMLKSLRKSIKKVSVSHEEPSKVRIPSKSSTARPSPRIVSSLIINPPETSAPEPAAVEDPETPITRKRRLMEEITDNLLSAMPPSPTDSDGAPPTTSSNNAFANAAAIEMKVPASGEAPIITMVDSGMYQHGTEAAVEGEIEPVTSTKPQAALAQMIRQNQAKNMIDDMHTPENNAAATAEETTMAQSAESPVNGVHRVPPPRPVQPPLVATAQIKVQSPSVQNSQGPKTTTSPFHLSSPPPRPSSPPRDQRWSIEANRGKCFSFRSTRSSTHRLPPPPRPSEPPPVDTAITCRTSTQLCASPVPHSAPSPTTVYSTASLDRKKIYRSKTETKATKRATLGRPVSANSTIFTPVIKTKTVQATDGQEVEKRVSKLKYQRTESFDWPFGGKHKKKPVEAAVARPQLISPPPGTARDQPLKALARVTGDEIVPVNANSSLQAASPVQAGMSLPGNMVSIGVQVGTVRTDGLLFSPVTTMKPEAAPKTTLLQRAMEARSSPQRPLSYFKEEFYNQCIKGLFKVESVTEEEGFPLPYITDRLSEWGRRTVTDLTVDSRSQVQIARTDEQNGEANADTDGDEAPDKTVIGPQQALQLLHPFLLAMQEGTTDAQEKCPNDLFVRSLRQYVASCVRLKDYDLQGEFGAFHWITGDLLKSGWSLRGCPDSWPMLRVFYDPVKCVDFVQLPPPHYAAGSLMYPDRTLDAMLTGWLDTRSTVLGGGSSTEDGQFERPTLFDHDFLHPTLAILRLSDLLQPSPPSASLLASLSLAVLLTADYCLHRLPKIPDADIGLDFRPEQILLLSTPSNCLVILRLQKVPVGEEINSQIVPLLQALGLQQFQSLTEALEECVKRLSSHVRSTTDLLPNLIRALSPPDWLALAASRIALLHAEKAAA